MSLWNSLRTVVIGVHLEEEQKRGDALDAQAADMNAEKLRTGQWDYGTYETATANWAKSKIDVVGEVDAAFKEGLDEGYANVTGAIKSTLKAPFQFGWDIIPWQLWVVALGFGFFYLGGFAMLRGILSKK